MLSLCFLVALVCKSGEFVCLLHAVTHISHGQAGRRAARPGRRRQKRAAAARGVIRREGADKRGRATAGGTAGRGRRGGSRGGGGGGRGDEARGTAGGAAWRSAAPGPCARPTATRCGSAAAWRSRPRSSACRPGNQHRASSKATPTATTFDFRAGADGAGVRREFMKIAAAAASRSRGRAASGRGGCSSRRSTWCWSVWKSITVRRVHRG